ncbi:MAG: hypothetical protein H6883_09760, partial [Rhodobiaceae bacterium]|nr:hypothetical protein [Rhodobiaceae bacterium]
IDPPAIASARDELLRKYQSENDEDVLEILVGNSVARTDHFAALGKPVAMPRGRPDTARLTAARKIVEANDLDELRGWVTPEERMAIVSDPGLVDLMQPLLGSSLPKVPEQIVAEFTGAAGAAE